MKLQCPKCRKLLPQVGNEIVVPGDAVQCGLCLHVWKLASPRELRNDQSLTVGRAASEGDAAPVVTKPFTSNEKS